MKLFHDSRGLAYRAPFGAVEVGARVTLALDVAETSKPAVTLRTWTDDAGERLYVMAPSSDNPQRYSATFTTKKPGVVWYHFIVRGEDGQEQRYGACQGRTGGTGLQLGWEPPSFQLTVYDPHDEALLASGAFNNTGLPGFREALVRFLRHELTAPELAETIATLRESYPVPAYQQVFEFLEASDASTLFAQLSGAYGNPAALDVESDLDDGQRGLAKGRLWCASLIRALMPVDPVPGAEADAAADAEGNAYDAIAERWDAVTADCETIVRNAADIRSALSLFTAGDYACFAVNDDVFGFWSRGADGQAACTLLNSSLQNAYDVLVPCVNEAMSEVIGGYGVPVVSADEAGDGPRVPGSAERYARVHLSQLGSAIAYFHGRDRLVRPMEAGLGVLAHITSIPGAEPDMPGTLGAPARAFIDWLASAGVRYWQVLPVNPTDNFGSPYAGISAFAGNTRLLEGGPLEAKGLPVPKDKRAYQAFCEREQDWLEPYAAFMAIRDKVGAGKTWQQWPKKYRRYDPTVIQADVDLAASAEQWRRAQFAFEQQWEDLRAYANEHGVKVVGDMPIYVSADSSDVWAHPELFQLDADGNPAGVAGCPPDQFAVDGQIWGNPVYDWDAACADGYAWWLRRLERAFELYDVVRLDHFIGFARYFSIPQGQKATAGAYHAGPGLEFFQAAFDKFGPLPIVAEDLGLITPAVRALVAACGFSGMDIVQFVDGNDPLSGYQPRPEKIAYSGTHDNQTLVGYCESRYPHLDAREAAERLMQLVADCNAPVRVFPLQDLMGLDDDARMNVPGTAEGNWTWQADADDLPRAAEELSKLA